MKPTDEQIEKFAIEYGGNHAETPRTIDAVMVGAKWARDQQPKLKPLVWHKAKDVYKWQSKTDIGLWYAVSERWTFCYKAQHFSEHDIIVSKLPCDSEDHGKQLTQADYEKRVNELYGHKGN
jgi:hypothetical protein